MTSNEFYSFVYSFELLSDSIILGVLSFGGAVGGMVILLGSTGSYSRPRLITSLAFFSLSLLIMMFLVVVPFHLFSDYSSRVPFLTSLLSLSLANTVILVQTRLKVVLRPMPNTVKQVTFRVLEAFFLVTFGVSSVISVTFLMSGRWQELFWPWASALLMALFMWYGATGG